MVRKTYGHVDQRDARPVVGVRLVGVDEGVLAPVPDHEAEPHQGQGEQEDEQGRVAIKEEQGEEGGVVSELPAGGLESHLGAVLAEEVQGQVEPDEEEEAPEVVQEVPDVVALVPHGGREVVRPVALDVVVLHVMVEVRVPGVAHQGVGDVGEQQVEGARPRPPLRQHPARVDVLVHHQRVRAHVIELHGEVQHAAQVAEVAVQPYRAGDGRGEVQDQVRHHDHVRLVPRDPPRPVHVR